MNTNNKFTFLVKFKEMLGHLTNADIHITEEEKNKISTNETNLTTHIEDKNNPHELKMQDLKDVNVTSLLDNQVLVWDSTENKYVNKFASAVSAKDNLVKMESTSTDSKYLSELIDNDTIVNDNEKLVAKKLEGQLSTIEEINYLQGLDDNIMTKLSALNGSVDVYTASAFNTYADLLTFNFSSLPQEKKWLVYVVDDENKNNATTMYVVDYTTNNTSNLPMYIGIGGTAPRDFTINKIDLTSEVKNKLPQTNIDMTNIARLPDLAGYMKTEDYTGSGTTSVNIAKTLEGMTGTVNDINECVDKVHEHSNVNVLNNIGEDAEGKLTYNGVPYQAIQVTYDESSNTLEIITV